MSHYDMVGKIFRLKIDVPWAREFTQKDWDDEYVEVLSPLAKNQLVKVVMASRFGDVGITPNLQADRGYTARVNPEDLEPHDG